MEPNRDVKPPIEQIVCYMIINQNLNSKKIPAVTIVALWSSALTGVGAAIASDIQPEKTNSVDLVKDANNNEQQQTQQVSWFKPGQGIKQSASVN